MAWARPWRSLTGTRLPQSRGAAGWQPHRQLLAPAASLGPVVSAPTAAAQPHSGGPSDVGRRALLLALSTSTLSAARAARADELQQQQQQEEIIVGPRQQFVRISDAVAAAPSGATIRVQPGRYAERLVLERPITIVGSPDDPSAVELVWETDEPYQPVIMFASDGAVVRGLQIRHRSPSIAQNYAVYFQDCTGAIDACDISSSTGSGIGSEGGSPQIYSCHIEGCQRHGIALFGGLDGARASPVVEGCELCWNRGHGLLVRDGATPAVSDSSVFKNGCYGLYLQDCGGSYSRCVVVENGAGSVAHQLLLEDFDIASLAEGNSLDAPPAKLSPLMGRR